MEQITFKTYPLSDAVQKGIEALGFKQPTPVQKEVIQEVLDGKDLIVKSKTGSGKTAAFAIPICDVVDWEENKPQAIVLTPTRELAMQVQEDFFNIGRFKRIKVVALYGKAPFALQQKAIKQKTHVVVGTPGRVIDHLEQGTWDPSCIKYLVIDEADEMLRMGFIEQVQTIINALPTKRVTLLFSATMPEDIERLCMSYMQNPKTIEIQSDSVATDRVKQSYFEVEEKDKVDAIEQLVYKENPESCMIFANTKLQVDEVHRALRGRSYPCMKLHGGMEQRDRQQVIEDFKKGYFRYLVATDVAARGIDVDHVTHVINYDVPEDKENYVHRIGRTGRAGRTGKAFTLVSPREQYYLKGIQSYIGDSMLKAELPQHVASVDKEAVQQKMRTRIQVEDKVMHQEIMKLHINAGKKTKMRPVDIVGTLCSLDNMSAEDIGIINVLDVSTFVEVLNNKGSMVLKALQNKPIKGRIRRVTVAER